MQGSLLTSEILNLSPKYFCIPEGKIALYQYEELWVKVVYGVTTLSGYYTLSVILQKVQTGS